MRLAAPAKVNLTLRVLRRRDDGFHEIETLITPISICDTLDFDLRDNGGIAFTCSDPSLPAGDDNLVVRAARQFGAAAGIEPNVSIRLTKGIPHGAGLGGGSSDAASTLLALNDICNTGLPLTTLAEIAAALGSDVPFFLSKSAAWCRGRGELVEPRPLAHTLPLLLIKPPFPVPTPWAYSRWRDSLEIPGVPYGPQEFDWGALANDLERPVFEKFLQLAEMKRWLLARPEVAGALMSGSGSTMFAVLREKAAGPALATEARAQFGDHTWISTAETI